MKHLVLIFFTCLIWFSCSDESKTNQPEETAEQADGAVPLDNPDDNDGIFETVSIVDTITGQVYKTRRPLNPLSTGIPEKASVKIDPVKPSYDPPQPKTPQESRVIRVLTSNYWAVWALVKMGDPAANPQNQGAWFKFKEDGTYDYGYFENKIGSGAWSFDGQKATLLLDSEVLGDDREWSIKIGSDEDVMIWVGTNRYATNNIQAKLQNYLFIPKDKSEMGYENK